MEEIIKQLDNKVVFIESKEMLEEARGLIEAKGMKVDKRTFILTSSVFNFLRFSISLNKFALGSIYQPEITFEQFKEIMK